MAESAARRCRDPQIERDLERLAGGEASPSRRRSYFAQSAPTGTRSARCMSTERGRGGAAEARRQAAVPVDARPRHRHRPAAGDLRAALRRGVGIDMSREMLAVARANLDKAGVAMRRCARATSTRRRSSATASTSSPSTRCCTISTTRRGDPRGGAAAASGRAAAHRRFRAARARVPARGARASAPRLRPRADRHWLGGGGARPRDDRRPRAGGRRRQADGQAVAGPRPAHADRRHATAETA